MFNKTSKVSKVGISTMNSDNGNRYGGKGFTNFISVNGMSEWKPSVGINRIDVIPYNATKTHPLVATGQADEGDTLYSLDIYVHKNVGPSNSNYVCLNQFGKSCPFCDEARRLRNLGTPEGEEQSKKLYSKRRIIYLIHDLDKNTYGYWDTGYKLVQQKISALEQFETDGNGGKANVFDWESGKTIRFMGTEKSLEGHKYVEPDGFNFASREPLSDEVLSHSVDLSTYLNIVDEEGMEKILSGSPEVVNNNTLNNSTPKVENSGSYSEPPVQNKQPQPTQTQPVQEQAAPVSPSNSCPYGHNWGEADHHNECMSCELWEKCVS